MPIEAGTRLGRYEVQSLLGVGGMGEVYRALDTELQRQVALKLLPAEFAFHPDRMKRFIQEARAASALNHPNIITVYDIGRVSADENAAPYFATELIDGVTLREYMSRGKLKLADVLDFVSQIASALVAAHQAGIIHRDIKPENIMVRKDGYVKVLDFGLAKPTERQANSVDSEAATRAFPHTDPGTIMGTVHYMSPEQARGSEVDARTDIWSLGIILYELVTGSVPFKGATPSHVLVSVLEKDPPPLTTFVPDAPESLQLIIDEALAKDPDERTQTAKQLVGKLRRLKHRVETGSELDRSLSPSFASDPGSSRFTDYRSGQVTGDRINQNTARSGELAHTTLREKSSRSLLDRVTTKTVAALIALVVAALAFGYYWYRSKNNRDLPFQEMKISKFTNNGGSYGVVISPDGKFVAHVQSVGEKRSLLLRQPATTSSRELVPLTDSYLLGITFSPDSNYVYYVKGEIGKSVRALYQVSVLGGEPRQLMYDVDSAVTFSPDGKRLAFIRGYLKELRKALFIASADGREEQEITSRRAPEFSSMDGPIWSPDGNTIAFTVGGTDAQGYFVNIDEVSVADKSERKISSDRWRWIPAMTWLPDSSGVLAVARDRDAIPGSPNQIWQINRSDGRARKLTNDLNYYMDISISGDSKTVAATVQNDQSTLWIATAGNLAAARQIGSGGLNGLGGVAWSPDGKIVYTSVERDNRDIWIMNADGSEPKQLTVVSSAEGSPSVSPDGKYISFVSNRGAKWGIWRMNIDGTNQTEVVANSDEEEAAPQFSADSESIIYLARKEGKTLLWKVSVNGGSPAQLTDKVVFGHTVSPDGKLIAYYHRPLELDSKLQIEIISTDGGAPLKTFPAPDASQLEWSSDGKSIDYVETREGVGNLWRISLDGRSPKQLSDWQQNLVFRFAWSPDGQRIACARGVRARDVVLIENLQLN